MWLMHEEFAPELGFLLRRRSYAEAVAFWKAARPLAQLTVPSADCLGELMETDPPCLAFLRPRERAEVQIAAGFASLVGATGGFGRFISRNLDWPHQVSRHAAIHNLLAAFQMERLVARMMTEHQGRKTRVRVQNSCEGACITSLLASSVEFLLEQFPPVPIVGCVNYEKGCRCSLVVASCGPRRHALSRLL